MVSSKKQITPLRAAIIWSSWMFIAQGFISLGLFLVTDLDVWGILGCNIIALGGVSSILGLLFGMIEVSENGTGPLSEANDFFEGLFRSGWNALFGWTKKNSRVIPPKERREYW